MTYVASDLKEIYFSRETFQNDKAAFYSFVARKRRRAVL